MPFGLLQVQPFTQQPATILGQITVKQLGTRRVTLQQVIQARHQPPPIQAGLRQAIQAPTGAAVPAVILAHRPAAISAAEAAAEIGNQLRISNYELRIKVNS
jgi:hypothetical protein